MSAPPDRDVFTWIAREVWDDQPTQSRAVDTALALLDDVGGHSRLVRKVPRDEVIDGAWWAAEYLTNRGVRSVSGSIAEAQVGFFRARCRHARRHGAG